MNDRGEWAHGCSGATWSLTACGDDSDDSMLCPSLHGDFQDDTWMGEIGRFADDPQLVEPRRSGAEYQASAHPKLVI